MGGERECHGCEMRGGVLEGGEGGAHRGGGWVSFMDQSGGCLAILGREREHATAQFTGAPRFCKDQTPALRETHMAV